MPRQFIPVTVLIFDNDTEVNRIDRMIAIRHIAWFQQSSLCTGSRLTLTTGKGMTVAQNPEDIESMIP
jgi:hypothetical protein